MACTSGCPTQTCPSYAACLRGKGTKVAYANSAAGYDYSQQKNWDKDITAYKDARAQGIQPVSTKREDVTLALRASDHTGTPFRADS